MKITIKVAAICAITIISTSAFIGCGEDRVLPTGLDVLGARGQGEIKEVEIMVSSISTRERETAMGLSQKLLLGSFKQMECRMLLRAGSLPDSATVEQAELQLLSIGGYGVSPGDLRIQIYAIDSSWVESSVKWSEFDHAGISLVSEETVTLGISDTIAIPLPVDLVNSWIDSSRQNSGILLASDVAEYVGAFYSFEGSVADLEFSPQLRATFREADSSRTQNFNLTSDATIMKSDAVAPGDRYWISNGVSSQIVVHFSALNTVIPTNATINRATLEMAAFPDEFVMQEDEGVAVTAFRVDSLITDIDSLSTALDFFQIVPLDTVYAGDEGLNLNVAEILQQWTAGSAENFGVLVRSASDNVDINRLSFATLGAEADKLPKLRVIYSVPPQSSF